jgi:hypothetical protein
MIVRGQGAHVDPHRMLDRRRYAGQGIASQAWHNLDTKRPDIVIQTGRETLG